MIIQYLKYNKWVFPPLTWMWIPLIKGKLLFHTIYTLHHPNVDNIYCLHSVVIIVHKFEYTHKMWIIYIIHILSDVKISKPLIKFMVGLIIHMKEWSMHLLCFGSTEQFFLWYCTLITYWLSNFSFLLFGGRPFTYWKLPVKFHIMEKLKMKKIKIKTKKKLMKGLPIFPTSYV